MQQVAVDPFAEGNLFFESHRVGGALSRAGRHAAERLQVLLLGDDACEGARHFLRLQVDADFLELAEVELSRRLQLLLVAELVDHQADLIAGQFEADLIERILQLFQFDEAASFFRDLEE